LLLFAALFFGDFAFADEKRAPAGESQFRHISAIYAGVSLNLGVPIAMVRGWSFSVPASLAPAPELPR
jgi:hypothetical protein